MFFYAIVYRSFYLCFSIPSVCAFVLVVIFQCTLLATSLLHGSSYWEFGIFLVSESCSTTDVLPRASTKLIIVVCSETETSYLFIYRTC